MAPVKKKSRRSIGSMSDTIVQETQHQSGTNSEGDLDDSDSTIPPSDNDSSNSDTAKSPCDGDDQSANSHDDNVNHQETVRRGHAKMGFEWGTGKVMLLELDSNNDVIGKNAVSFSSQLGILAKDGNRLPLSYTDWRAVPNPKKDIIWNEVKENTNLTDDYKKTCMLRLGKLWKDWKSRLKRKFYTPHRHDKATILSNCPQRVEPDQWPVLVNYWSSNNAKKLSKINRKSWQQVKLPPRMGRKDMASAKDEYRREHGKEPSKLDLFIYSRQKRSEKPVDKNTEDKVARLIELKQRLPEELVDDIETNDAIFDKVIGGETPASFRSNHGSSKNKDLVYISKEEFERAVEDRSNDKITSMQKEFEAKFSKFQDEYYSRMDLFQRQLLTLKGQNTIASGSFNSRLIQAPNNGSSPQELMDLDLSRQIIREMRKEIDNHDENDTDLHLDGVHLQEQENTTRSKKKKTKHP